MHILIITQYFWPENFRINDIALGLKERGHKVSVLTGIPNYPSGTFFDGYTAQPSDEIWEGIYIYRSRLTPRGKGRGIDLLKNYFSFAFSASLKVSSIKEKIDTILVFEPSPITVGIPAMVAKRKFGASYSFWVQDLWPASLTAAGGVKNKFVLRFFDWLTRKIYNHAKYVLVQSRTFKDYILNQGVKGEKILYVPNSTEGYYHPMAASPKFASLLPKGFKIMFAGNIGEAQSLNTMLEAAKILKNKGYVIQWVMIGDGRYRPIMEEQVRRYDLSDSIHFLGKFPPEEMSHFFSHADALYVSLRRDYIFSLTIPSKVQSYLACGKPILASLDGEGAKIVVESGAGLASPAEDVTGLVENVIELYERSEGQREELGKRGLRYFNREFDRNIVLNKLEGALKL
ncbi:glycosyltransferase family 4 protein [Sphingobacterium paludis]|uniref:Glycosyltransferase involved in cell wall biosynthesis n=1 Tax=Sphingobacterium paludis TaxID=1476465 RepID=A0A4R7CYM0_9SPHI|nr:glycosyltransferase family 4 protein [Sphingobacterium paludis]TDS13703.1 glycosyltransferase involved in cell wall biosynthesis [Sphingobacterium paludis]